MTVLSIHTWPSGCDLIAAERRRQVEVEGWTAEHDAVHGGMQLLRAAEAYEWDDGTCWPWGEQWWKPKDALSNLIRAGALYQASADLGGVDLDGFTDAADAAVTRCAEKIDALLATALSILTASGALVEVGTLVEDEDLLRRMAIAHFGDLRSEGARRAGAGLMKPYVNALASILQERAQ